ncbi:SCP2 sterol-binding domain-containing protein [Thiococcus pfennigii]|uniref:SCP2 sterol-binding domain-containing protein n=1 Tax=Thiococcus pfennigii TaxID=1057 RepID=UPI001904622C|nr:SCP2 sterol-binding domain-containing protein [Thiococcus pfennigii]MBK1700857.1 SCP-2 sterol transfer family protein [Thiococcus pfennigii]MBK1730476.1 SCP-2 sterol transfer family protein [Thiococcus pfennigii]
MAKLFSAEWMTQFKDAWNSDPEIKDKLAEIGFKSTIAWGFKDEDDPRGLLVVENGECVRAAEWAGEAPDWDLRADLSDWLKWVEKGIGMMGLGAAYATGKLKFKTGDYKSMIKDPRMAGPFVKTFGILQKIGADELR